MNQSSSAVTDHHFKYLARDIMEQMIRDPEQCQAYMDCVWYLYELACRESELLATPRLSYDSAMSGINALLKEPPVSQAPMLIENIRSNLAIALSLRRRCRHPEEHERASARQDATSFLISLVRSHRLFKSVLQTARFEEMDRIQVDLSYW